MVDHTKIYNCGPCSISLNVEKYLMVPVRSIPENLRRPDWSPEAVVIGLDPGTEFGFVIRPTSTAIAVVPSIRGVNPLTGMKADGALQRYGRGTLCPCDSTHGRLGKKGFCSTCNHYWPMSNYVSARYSATLPGWRVGDSEYRKFVATEDGTLDVASHIDAGSVVDAVGFAVYKMVEARYTYFPYWGFGYNYSYLVGNSNMLCSSGICDTTKYGSVTTSYTSSISADNFSTALNTKAVNEMSVGAGAAVAQKDNGPF